jgi:hypothetical protein
MSIGSKLGLIHANFFFIDIVGLSDPTISTRNQIKKIETLNNLIGECPSFSSISKESMLILPTGDGMAIGFMQGPQIPLGLSIELHKTVAKYNRGKIPSESLRIRIGIHSGPVYVVSDILKNGIHSGPVYVVSDILKNRNIWGPGIIIARRIMDIGDDGHILMSARTAEDLRELSYEYRTIIKPLHDYHIKHGQNILVYSVYGKGFGNARPPTKSMMQKSRMHREILKLKKSTIYPYIGVLVTIGNNEGTLVHYKREYEIFNVSIKPIYRVLHGIATDVPSTFNDLNIEAYDENKIPLRISSINMDKPYQKEFTTVFNKPILQGENGRYYVLEYDAKEPEKYFENSFLVGCEKFTISFNLPKIIRSLVIIELNIESGEKKTNTDIVLQDSNKGRLIAEWTRKNIHEGQSFRFEWN